MRNILTKDTKTLQIPKLERLAGEKDSNIVAEDATKEIKIDFFVEQGFKKIIFGIIIGKNRNKNNDRIKFCDNFSTFSKT